MLKILFISLFFTTLFGEHIIIISAKWGDYKVATINFIDNNPETKGSKIYHKIIPNPQKSIKEEILKVLDLLYFSPKDRIPKVKEINYILKDYAGISSKSGFKNSVNIEYSTRELEKETSTAALLHESNGVLIHELTHVYQLEPQGIGNYSNSRLFRAMIEGVADATRYLSGYFTEEDCPQDGSILDGYKTTGFFLAWITKKKNPDFLKKFNASTIYIIPWSFDGAIKYALGEEYSEKGLWEEYQKSKNNLKEKKSFF